MKVAVGSVERSVRSPEPLQFLEAANGERGIVLAWRHQPDIVVADEIA